MKRYLTFLLSLLLLFTAGMGVAAALQQDASSPQSNSKPAAAAADKGDTQAKTGEQVFEANCSRCNRPPMTIAPRATGTVIMHMRGRARLSRQDEQLLLKFMAP